MGAPGLVGVQPFGGGPGAAVTMGSFSRGLGGVLLQHGETLCERRLSLGVSLVVQTLRALWGTPWSPPR